MTQIASQKRRIVSFLDCREIGCYGAVGPAEFFNTIVRKADIPIPFQEAQRPATLGPPISHAYIVKHSLPA